MLIALAKKKVPRDLAGREDVITSTVLGPLRYLDATQVWRVVRHLLGDDAVGFPEPPAGAAGATVEFWPRQCVPHDQTMCEPDVVIELCRVNEPCCARVIIEVKWNAPASGVDQLARQKAAFGLGPVPCWHVYLTKHHLRADEDIEAAGLSSGEVINLPWSLLVSRLSQLSRLPEMEGDGLLKAWATDVGGAMERLGVVPFSGFAGAVPRSVEPGLFMFFNAFAGFTEVAALLPQSGTFDFFHA